MAAYAAARDQAGHSPLGQHTALQQTAEALPPDDIAFLDDLYVVTMPSSAGAVLDVTVHTVEDRPV